MMKIKQKDQNCLWQFGLNLKINTMRSQSSEFNERPVKWKRNKSKNNNNKFTNEQQMPHTNEEWSSASVDS